MGELKPGWKRVKFGQVVRLNREICKDPTAHGVKRVIGLEHIEPGDLRLRAWADVADGTAFTNRVRPGQVLFGKRRAYQRKVAVADFDAVCSGDICVFESADPTRLLPELLPFICQTDSFFEHAVGTSAGSLSPRTNWASLAEYEFALPPCAEQNILIGLFKASVEIVDASKELLLASKNALQSALAELINDRRRISLSDICSEPITYGIVQAGPHIPDGIPYIRVSDMTGVRALSLSGMLRTSVKIAGEYSRSQVRSGDLVVALRGVGGHCLPVPPELDGANLTQGTARLRVSAKHNPRYVLWALRSPIGRREIRKYLRGWKGESLLEITLGDLRSIAIPTPTREDQDRVTSIIDDLESTEIEVEKRHSSANSFFRILLQQTLESSHELH